MAEEIPAETPAPEDLGIIPLSYGAKALAYGPVVGEHHHDAMVGPNKNKLGTYDFALSPNLEEKIRQDYPGWKLGDLAEIKVNGESIGTRRFGDRSFISPERPTHNVVELRDRDVSGAHVSVTPIPSGEGELPEDLGIIPISGKPAAVPSETPTFTTQQPSQVSAEDIMGKPEEAEPQETPVPHSGTISVSGPDVPHVSVDIDQSRFYGAIPEPTPIASSEIQQPDIPSAGATAEDLGIIPLGQQPPPAQPTPLPPPPQRDVQPSWLQNAVAAAKETGFEMLPHTFGELGGTATNQFIPLIQGGKDVTQSINAVSDWIGGQPLEKIAEARFPQSQLLKNADKTPAYSKARFKAGFKMLGMMGAAAGVRTQMSAMMQRRLAENAIAGHPEAPLATPEVAGVIYPPGTSQFANRFRPEKQAAGILGEVKTGIALSTEELVDRGMKMTSEERMQHASDVMNGNISNLADQTAAIRAEEARLSDRSTRLSQIAKDNPTAENKFAAQEAFDDVTDWHNGPVAAIKRIWSNMGRAMQGDIPIDLSTLNGQREAWLRDVGTPPPAEALDKLRSLAENMSKANQKMTDLQKLWRQDAQSLNPRVTPEMVREQILVKLKKLTPC